MKLVSKGFLFLAPLALLARELLEIISFFGLDMQVIL